MSDTMLIIGKPEEWPAPDGATAQRWADEINARGGYAEVVISGNAYTLQWKVCIVRASPQHRITPSP